MRIYMIDGVKVPLKAWKARQIFGERISSVFTWYELPPKNRRPEQAARR